MTFPHSYHMANFPQHWWCPSPLGQTPPVSDPKQHAPVDPGRSPGSWGGGAGIVPFLPLSQLGYAVT